MKHRTATLVVAFLTSLLIASTAFAQGERTYLVTVTNITPTQIISPPVLATHAPSAYLFRSGQPASDELAALAEDADSTGLLAALDASRRVFDYTIADGPIPPGESVTLEIQAAPGYFRLSAVGMLVSTNDAFFGLDSFALSNGRRTQRLSVPAYDSGSEANNETCDFIPGPPCGNAFQRDTAGAEGFVHVHRGVHGVADLSSFGYDWRNPVVSITIRRQ